MLLVAEGSCGAKGKIHTGSWAKPRPGMPGMAAISMMRDLSNNEATDLGHEGTKQ